MPARGFRKLVYAGIVIVALLTTAFAETRPRARTSIAIPTNTLLQIIRAEDQRRWDDKLKSLLSDKDPKVRTRAALAAGRIGDEGAVLPLIDLLKKDTDWGVQQMAAFALGEIESPKATDALIEATRISDLRARALEALGKIAAALPPTEEQRRQAIGQVVLDALVIERKEAGMTAGGVRDSGVESFGLTAVLRARLSGAGKVVASYLSSPDPRVCAGALNTLARLRLQDGNDQARRMLDHSNPIVRANAARVLGATEDKGAFDALLDRALHDEDLRVRVSAIRSLGSLKDARALDPLSSRAVRLVEPESLEIATTLGNIFAAQGGDKRPGPMVDSPIQLSKDGFVWFGGSNGASPEVHVAAAKISPKDYLGNTVFNRPDRTKPRLFNDWRLAASTAQALGTIAKLDGGKYGSSLSSLRDEAQGILRAMLADARISRIAIPDILTAYIAFKPSDATETLRLRLNAPDVVIRATAAELLANQASDETNARALIDALKAELPRTEKGELNDAALAILGALAKQKNKEANEAIKTALDSSDHLLRRRAVTLLKANGAGDFSDRIGTVKTRNTEADYRRAIARIGRRVTATVVTSKGSFVIEFLPVDAPLTVDNFINLARKGYFNGQAIPRVVPNFVIQAGDPRGDTNGGPGYQIRCEINKVLYERGAVGMALSGKDTGGSQWFVTHSPQPHLDGGYTVFGHVIRGMEVVDNIARGDIIRRVIVNER